MSSKVGHSMKGKVAIVTGSGAHEDGMGNGRATAILLAEHGCSVLCVDINEKDAVRTEQMILADGNGLARTCVGDVSSAEDCERIVKTAVSYFGRLDILVNNVGIRGPVGNAVQMNMSQWDQAMNVNVKSMVHMAKYAIPEMLKNTDDIKGSIVNIGSVAGLGGGTKNLLFYPLAKGAVTIMTQTMALNHGKDGIRVNCVCPGSVYTPMVERAGISDKIREARAKNNMLGIEGYGWDVGYAVRWLSGPHARWVTGVIMPVDAGLSAIVPIEAPDM